MKTRTISRCPKCGKVKSKYSHLCKRCSNDDHEKSVSEARAIVETKTCPQCGAGLKRNLALAGWWQCEQYGAVGFRKDATKPSCSFQCFTQ